MLQESKQARKHASQLATRANETQRELSRQEREAEKLRGDLEEAQRVSQVPSGCVVQSLEGVLPIAQSTGSIPAFGLHCMGNALGPFLGSPPLSHPAKGQQCP